MQYIATPSSPETRAAMSAGRLVCMTTPRQGNRIPDGAQYACDNGKFGQGWPGFAPWYLWLWRKIQRCGADRCVFATAPDVVGHAKATLKMARPWLPAIRSLGIPAAFVAQDGCDAPGLIPWGEFDVLFLGGTDAFKLGSAARTVTAEALARGLTVHMGRVNSLVRMRLADEMGCASVDGTYLVSNPYKNLPVLLGWLDEINGKAPAVQHEDPVTAGPVRVGRPRLLDLYCGVGGAAKGYHRAGFEVTGVDIEPQPDYPFDLYLMDVLALTPDAIRSRFDAIHASPPCQFDAAITRGTNAHLRHTYPDLFAPTRALLEATGLPYVIENPAARPDVVLCGEMFGLSVIRHRRFELGGWSMAQPEHLEHRGRVAGYRHGEWFTGPYFAVYGNGGGKGTVAQWQTAMGIDWTSERKSIAEAVPPAYAEHVGTELAMHLRARVAA